jgi:hypothetical protein
MTRKIFALLFGVLFASALAGTERVLMSDIRTLTFVKGQLANRVRTPVQPVLQCVGGSAMHHEDLHPRQMQCTNMGSDGNGGLSWSCEAADMSERARFFDARVRCEGYEYPGDPFVRAGSCLVQYTLDLVPLPPPPPPATVYAAHRPDVFTVTVSNTGGGGGGAGGGAIGVSGTQGARNTERDASTPITYTMPHPDIHAKPVSPEGGGSSSGFRGREREKPVPPPDSGPSLLLWFILTFVCVLCIIKCCALCNDQPPPVQVNHYHPIVDDDPPPPPSPMFTGLSPPPPPVIETHHHHHHHPPAVSVVHSPPPPPVILVATPPPPVIIPSVPRERTTYVHVPQPPPRVESVSVVVTRPDDPPPVDRRRTAKVFATSGASD